jgi:ankyrin repeat protein
MTLARALAGLMMSFTLATTTACTDKPSAQALQAFPSQDAARVADAIMADDAPRVSALVKGGADVNAVGEGGRSLLEFAIWKEKPKAFGALVAAGADTAHADAQGDTALHLGAKDDDATYVTALLAKKADPNVINAKSGVSPIMDAALTGHLPQLHALLQAGAKLDLAASNGDTALIKAAQASHTQAILDLLAAGADPLAKNKVGATFQRYLNMSNDGLTPQAQHDHEAINRWLTAHNIAIES